STAPAGRNEASVLNGVYRVKWSEKEAVSDGVPPAFAHGDFGYANGNQIVITMTLRNSHLELQAQPPFPAPCTGTYAVSGNEVSILQTLGCQGRVTARWSLQKSQLRLHVRRASYPGDAVVWARNPWQMI